MIQLAANTNAFPITKSDTDSLTDLRVVTVTDAVVDTATYDDDTDTITINDNPYGLYDQLEVTYAGTTDLTVGEVYFVYNVSGNVFQLF